MEECKQSSELGEEILNTKYQSPANEQILV
jgi:hypothetical protein